MTLSKVILVTKQMSPKPEVLPLSHKEKHYNEVMDTKLLDVNYRKARLSARLWTPFFLSSFPHKAGAGLGICSSAEECLPGT